MQSNFEERSHTIDDIKNECDVVTVLSLDDEDLSQDRLRLLFDSSTSSEAKVLFLTCKDKEEALKTIAQRKVHVLLLDVDLGRDLQGNEQNGIELIPTILDVDCSIQILMITGSHNLQDCAEAMRAGAFGYVTKDMDNEVIRAQIEKATHVARLEMLRQQSKRTESQTSFDIAGESSVMKNFRRRLQATAETSRPILLIGETGTGKSHSARLLHEYRKLFLKQKHRPFFAANVAELGKERIENELFGHDRGAYTGADQAKEGYFELSDGGTLFLDEIGELSLDLQSKLLKVLDDKKFRRLGSGLERSSNFQLICATNRPLEQMVEKGEFREDLYMRISTFVLRLPTLAERKEDIPHLVRALLPKACVDNSVFVEFEDLPTDFIEYLKEVPFKGNVRGLEQQLSRLLLFSPRDRSGRPMLNRWRDVPGIAIKRAAVVANQNPKSLVEFIGQNLDFHSPDFKGFSAFIDDVTETLFRTAFSRLSSSAEVARAFKLSEGAVSQRKKLLGIQSKKALKEVKV